MGETMGTKDIWKTVERITKTGKKTNLNKLSIEGVITKNKEKIAQGLNEFFINKVKGLVEKMPNQPHELEEELKKQEPVDIPKMNLKEISPGELDQLMNTVKKTPAAGIDCISGIILHDIFSIIKPSLLHLINLSMATGVYPKGLKLTKIIPVLKPGKDPMKASSYRPVSNLSVIGKLLERSVMNQVNTHGQKQPHE